MAWAAVAWTLSWAGGFASKLAHSLGFWGKPQHLTTWSSVQVAWETASFPQGQWIQTGRRKPPHQVWVCHTVTSVMCNHEKWSLSPAHSVERTYALIFGERSVEGVVNFHKTITHRKMSDQLNRVFSGDASFTPQLLSCLYSNNTLFSNSTSEIFGILKLVIPWKKTVTL